MGKGKWIRPGNIGISDESSIFVARVGSTIIASSEKVFLFQQRWYFPPNSLEMTFFRLSEKKQKKSLGEQHFYHIILTDGTVLANAAWGYNSAQDPAIRRCVTFVAGKNSVGLVDLSVEKPQGISSVAAEGVTKEGAADEAATEEGVTEEGAVDEAATEGVLVVPENVFSLTADGQKFLASESVAVGAVEVTQHVFTPPADGPFFLENSASTTQKDDNCHTTGTISSTDEVKSLNPSQSTLKIVDSARNGDIKTYYSDSSFHCSPDPIAIPKPQL